MHCRIAPTLAFAILLIAFCGAAWSQQIRTGKDARIPIRDLATERLLARQKWRMAGRRIRGTNSASLRAKAIQQKLKIRTQAQLVSGAIPGTSGVWVPLGPMPLASDASGSGLQDYGFVSGRATAVAIDPNDPTGNTVFAGGAYAGVWKSTNAGTASSDPASVTWTPLSDDQATLAIGSIAVQPQVSNPASSIVLAGTGETDSSTDSYYGLGILRSADGGLTWNLISQDVTGTHSFAGLGFSQIAFSTANPALVVAAAGSASEGILEGLESPIGANRGLYFSSNAGVSWRATSVSDSGASITPDSATAVFFNPASATNTAAPKFFAAIRFHGFYSSSDAINWTRLPNQPGTGLTSAACPAQTASSSICPMYRGAIAFVPKRAGPSSLGEMYVWYVDANNADQGIWSSLDGGTTWRQIDEAGITNCGDLFGGCGTEQGAFDLTLAAVPDGPTATDLYAGAVNIYKCTITDAFPTCGGTDANTFLNLTHAYGCSDIAKVHPAQHAMDSVIANGVAQLYFANDGGIYRALNGYSGLTTGTCGENNQFDSLNETLGPMAQFISLSESSSDANLIFGGTQDNGAPATAFSQSEGAWVNVDAGDNGSTTINPSNEDEWFVATPPNSVSGVNVLRCANGISCHSQDFQNDQVADSNLLDGDTGPFYLPFILDPQDFATLILGTCRIWRGASAGGSFSLLSPDFETGGTGSCSGDEINTVRSIAAGGLPDPNGLSQVIYAGTNGDGPFISTTPIGGHVWVTTNADAGPLSWTDVTQSINPQGFPISSIVLDSTDPLGKTAYLAVMGFHTSHVWKTTNAGASWTDFTANLPDAPANTIVVDSGTSLSNGTVYVGTDVGVFASSTGAASWGEIGPLSAQTGFLPNVAVTALRIFNAGGLKRLRAATYGRGIWEWNLITTPDFQLNVSNNPLTILPAQTATFNGTVLALNKYSSSVKLSCVAGGTSLPQQCAVNPNSLVPGVSGAKTTVTASGNIGDYFFNLHAVGTDSTSITHDFSLTLHIADFALGVPSPGTVSVAPGNISPPVSFQLTALGRFTGAVALSCSNLPPGASCQFLPSSSVSPTNGNPVSVTMAVSTSNTPVGTFPITINALTSGEPSKTQTFSLIVGTSPDYSLSISNLSSSAPVGTSASFNGTLTAINGYNNSVAISCGAGAPSSCNVNSGTVTTSSSGTQFAVTVSSGTSQTYNFNIVAVGTDAAAITHSSPVTFTATPTQSFDFTMEITPTSASTPAGQPSSNFRIDVNPTTGSFPSNVTFSCSKLPALTTCGFNPTQVGSGSQNSVVQFTLSSTAPVAASAVLLSPTLVLPIAGLFFLKRRKVRVGIYRAIFGLVVIVSAGSIICCGGGLHGSGGGSGSPGTPPGTYTVIVTATCASVAHSAQVSLTVTP